MKTLLFTLLSLSLFLFAFSHKNRNILATGFYYAGERTDSSILVTGKKDSVYVYPHAILLSNGFKKVKVTKNEMGPMLNITLTPDAAKQFAVATSKWTGKKIAVIINGEVIIAPTVMSEIAGGEMNVTGNFTKKELNDLKALIEKEMKKK